MDRPDISSGPLRREKRLKIVADRNTPLIGSAFGEIGELTLVDTGTFTPELLRDADVLIVRSETRVDERLLGGSAVRFVGTVTIGTDHIDTQYLASRGIAFASAPGSNANSVKEYVLAALLELGSRLGFSLSGITLGIVGVGNIGSRVAPLAERLGMRVLLNDPPLARSTGDARYLPLDALMDADVITIHVPLTKDGPDPTVRLFDDRRIRAMKRGAVLINSSRGPVVHGESLLRATRDGHLSAAVLDVWEGEPAIDAALLRTVALGTPHIAGYSLDGKVNAVVKVRDAVLTHFGLQQPWDPWSEVPPPRHTIELPESGSPDQHLRAAVTWCYDIAGDDAALRQTLTLQGEDRPRAFSSLRKQYRVRREFRNFSLKGGPLPPASRQALETAGFRLQE